MQRTYKTAKGTELPLMNLRGKEYLEVKYRLVWFREEHPDWAIETELLSVNPESAYSRAVVKDEHGRVIATSHKFESKKGFTDFLEKAETGAIGRALALIGYGTQFCADDLDEAGRSCEVVTGRPPDHSGERAPSPVLVSGVVSKEPGDYLISFGRKYKGMKLKSIPNDELSSYVAWLEETAMQKGMPLSDEVRYLKLAVNRYLDLVGENSK
jgi:hypothetical protein